MELITTQELTGNRHFWRCQIWALGYMFGIRRLFFPFPNWSMTALLVLEEWKNLQSGITFFMSANTNFSIYCIGYFWRKKEPMKVRLCPLTSWSIVPYHLFNAKLISLLAQINCYHIAKILLLYFFPNASWVGFFFRKFQEFNWQ